MKLHFLVFFAALSIVSCSKNDAEKFVGSYSGAVVCPDEPDEPYPTAIVIAEGSKDNAITLTITSDGETFVLNGTVDGNKVTIPVQEIGELEETLGGTGTLDGDDLTIDFDSSGDICTFEGSK